jgi:hypothetical protein
MPKYAGTDPVARDMFSALDVSLVVPLTLLVEGAQADRRMAEIACATAATVAVIFAVAAGVYGATMATVIAAVSVAAVGWAVQGIRQLRGGAVDRGRATDRVATWLVTVVSVVHFITLWNLNHPELAGDLFIRWGRRVVFVLHATVGVALAVTLLVMDELNAAWGCYARVKGTSGLDTYEYGPCGRDTDNVPWTPNQAVCRDTGIHCGPEHSATQMADRPLQYTLHAETAAFALYSVMCFHALAVYTAEAGSGGGAPAARRGTTAAPGSTTSLLL